MRGRFAYLFIFLGAASIVGCKSDPPCTAMNGMQQLLSDAALIKVDVYDAASAHCEGMQLAAGAPAPLLSRTFARGETVRLDVLAGDRTVVLTTFSDAAGSLKTGEGCGTLTLSGGKKACLSVSLVQIELDLSVPVGGCGNNDECADAGTTPFCDTARRSCVECLTANDCAPGLQCSASGRCAESCAGGGACTGNKICCQDVCVDTRTDPLHCGMCGMACLGGDTLCCNGQCANPATSTTHCGGCGNTCSTQNGTPTCSGGSCAWTCSAGFIHCGTGNTGCETASNTVDNCGGCGNKCMPTNATANSCNGTQCSYTCAMGFDDCVKTGANTDGCESPVDSITACGGCGQACDTVNSVGASCAGGVCTYSGCAAGRADCDTSGANNNGCECSTPMCCGGTLCQAVHMNGLGQSYTYMCQPLGMPGSEGTYLAAMAAAAADAWSTTAGAAKNCMGSPCVTRTMGGQCATWCYQKSSAGYVDLSANTTCNCPDPGTDMPWN